MNCLRTHQSFSKQVQNLQRRPQILQNVTVTLSLNFCTVHLSQCFTSLKIIAKLMMEHKAQNVDDVRSGSHLLGSRHSTVSEARLPQPPLCLKSRCKLNRKLSRSCEIWRIRDKTADSVASWILPDGNWLLFLLLRAYLVGFAWLIASNSQSTLLGNVYTCKLIIYTRWDGESISPSSWFD